MINKKINHVPYVIRNFEEVVLLDSKSEVQIKRHILWYGFRSSEGQIKLAQSDFTDLILLQHRFHRVLWCNEAKDILIKRSLIDFSTKNDELTLITAFFNWYYACWHSSRSNEYRYGKLKRYWLSYGVELMPDVDEKTQLDWFFTPDGYSKVAHYKGAWKGMAIPLFLRYGAEEDVFFYLKYHLLKEEEQIALIERDIGNDDNNLIWYYFSRYSASSNAQKLVQSYDKNLWRCMIIVNYGWEHAYERKFGCLRKWQEKLEQNLSLLEICPIEEIRNVLDTIR